MYHCVTCNRLFGSQTALKQHQQSSPMHKKSFECRVCDLPFGSEQALDQHRRDAPAHAEDFDCKTCNRSFGSASALKQHQRDSPIHRNPSQASIPANLRSPSSQTSESPDSKVGHHSQGIDLSRRDSGISTAKPAVKKSSKRKVETREFFTYPELHQSVAEAIAPQTSLSWFYEDNHNSRHNREHSTKVMGKFVCNNTACKKQSWGSKIVAVWIKEHARRGYSAVVYNQRCRSCDFLGDLTMDKECYIERVAYRLKKWAGVEMERPPFEPKKGPPHETELCEGCKRGVCPQVKGLETY